MNRAMPAPDEFNTPHSIAADAQGNIYVADRGNRRIQVFDHDGNFKKIITIDVPVAPDAKSWFSNAGTPQDVGDRRRALGHLHHARAWNAVSI